MINIHIYDYNDLQIETKLPVVPCVGDNIGVYICGDINVFEILRVFPLLKEDNTLDAYWIDVDANFEEIKRRG